MSQAQEEINDIKSFFFFNKRHFSLPNNANVILYSPLS